MPTVDGPSSGRADGEADWRPDDQPAAIDRPRDPERCVKRGEVSLLLLLRIDSFMFSLSAGNQYFSYFFIVFFSFFRTVCYCFRSLVSGLGLCYNFSPCRRPVGLSLFTADWTRLAASCLFEKCLWNINKLVTLNGLAHLLGASPCSLLTDQRVGGTLREAAAQLIDFYRGGFYWDFGLGRLFGNYYWLCVQPTGSATS